MTITDYAQIYELRDLRIDGGEPDAGWAAALDYNLDGSSRRLMVSYPDAERLIRAIAIDYTDYLARTRLGCIAWREVECTCEYEHYHYQYTATVTIHLAGEHFPVAVELTATGSPCGAPVRWTRGSKRQQQEARGMVMCAYGQINACDRVAAMMHDKTDPMLGIKRHACAVVRAGLDRMLAEADGDPRIIIHRGRDWRVGMVEMLYKQQVEIDSVGA